MSRLDDRVPRGAIDDDGDTVRVAHLLHHLTLGGLETQVLRLVESTNDPGIEYTVCYLGADDSLRGDFEAAGARVVSLDTGSGSLLSQFHPRSIRTLTRYLRSERFDVLHTHVSLYVLVLGRICGALSGTPIIGTYHNSRGNYHPVMRVLERLTRPFSATNIAVSRDVERTYASTSDVYRPGEPGGTFDRSTYTIHNGIDVEGFEANVRDADTSELRSRWGVTDELVYLSVGRYAPEKNQETLIRAMADVTDAVPDAKLFLVGWGPLEGKLRETVAELDLDDTVFITGRVPSVHAYYALADVFVLPSLTEGLSVVLLEAMAAGLPVIGTDVEGTGELVVDGETGIVIPPNSRTALADAMCEMAVMDLEALGEHGRERVGSGFDIETMIGSYLDIYRRLATSSMSRVELGRE